MSTDFLITGGALRGQIGSELLLELGVAPLARGTRLGQFQIEGLLGSGGGGHVHKAFRVDAGFSQEVAIKVVDAGSGHARTAVEEAAVFAQFSHPNIAHVYDAGATADGRTWFAMELVEGAAIDAFCSANALRLTQRLRLLVQVCEAIAFAQGRGVVHSDIKAANVLVTQAGIPKLLDFGIAVRSNEQQVSVIGACTLSTASPEQLRGQSVSFSSDIYQLGLLIQSCCVSSAPRFSIIEKAQIKVLKKVIERATNANPDARYPSAQALAMDLEQIIGLRPPKIATTHAASRAALMLARHQGTLPTILLLLALTLSLALLVSTYQRTSLVLSEQRATEQLGAEQAQSFLVGLLQNSGNASGAIEESTSELTAGAERVRELLKEQPHAGVTAGAVLADLYLRVGERAKAVAFLESLGADLEALWPELTHERARLAVALMRMQGSVGSIAEFTDAVDQAAQLAERAQLPPESIDWLAIGRSRVLALDRVARPREAILAADRLIAGARSHGLHLSSHVAGVQFTRGMIRWYSLDDSGGLEDLQAGASALFQSQGAASSFLYSASFHLASVQAFEGQLTSATDLLINNLNLAKAERGSNSVEADRASASHALLQIDWGPGESLSSTLELLGKTNSELTRREPDAMFTLDIASGYASGLLDLGEANRAAHIFATVERDWRRRAHPSFVFVRLAQMDLAAARCVAAKTPSARLPEELSLESQGTPHRLLMAKLALRRAQCLVARGHDKLARDTLVRAQSAGATARWNNRERRIVEAILGL